MSSVATCVIKRIETLLPALLEASAIDERAKCLVLLVLSHVIKRISKGNSVMLICYGHLTGVLSNRAESNYIKCKTLNCTNILRSMYDSELLDSIFALFDLPICSLYSYEGVVGLCLADHFLHVVNTCLPWLKNEWASVESEDTSLLHADIQKVNDKGFFS